MFGVQRQPGEKEEGEREREKLKFFLSLFLFSPRKRFSFQTQISGGIYTYIFSSLYNFFFFGIIYISVARVWEELGGGGGYSIKFFTGRPRSDVQPVTFSHTFIVPLSYTQARGKPEADKNILLGGKRNLCATISATNFSSAFQCYLGL